MKLNVIEWAQSKTEKAFWTDIKNCFFDQTKKMIFFYTISSCLLTYLKQKNIQLRIEMEKYHTCLSFQPGPSSASVDMARALEASDLVIQFQI